MTERRDTEAELRAGADAFDRDYYATFGRYPAESPLFGTDAGRAATREKIARLVAESPFEGERASARARLAAFDAPSHAEHDRMQRGGNYAPSEDAHARTERGSYYARDTLTHGGDE